MFLKPHVWTQFVLSYQNSLIKGLRFLARMFEFSQAHVKVSMAVNSSLTKWNPQTQVQGKRPATGTEQSSQTPFLLCSVQFLQCNCQYSDECRNGKNAILHMTDCTAKGETYRKPQAGNLFYIIPCCYSVMNASVIHFNTLKSLGICNMLWTRYKLIAQPYLFF